jgi:alpha-glucosidase
VKPPPLILTLALLLSPAALPAQRAELTSPDGQLRATFFRNSAGELCYQVDRAGRPVILPSRLGISVDGMDFSAEVQFREVPHDPIDETFSVPGVKARSHIQGNALGLDVRHGENGRYFLHARVFNDGFAWRVRLPGSDEGTRIVTGEPSTWTFPAKSRVWFAERNSDWKLKTGAGEFISADISAMPTISKQGPVQVTPLTVELPENAGYALITEAALAHYSGLRLRAIGGNAFQADFTEGNDGTVIQGTITTPWRVVIVTPDLDRLVNQEVIYALNEDSDPTLFADTSYIRPGRSVWRWFSHGTGKPEEERKMIDFAAELGFEYTSIDDGWEKWPAAWTRVRELVDHARGKNVGVFVWKDKAQIDDPAGNYAMAARFLDQCRDNGVVGVKVDFFNSQEKTSVDLQRAILRLAAERRLLVNFHGLQKPTGESRTFPNEITREAVRGLELNLMGEAHITASHNAALPFTRYSIGHADYTPLSFTKPGPTTWAHQLGTVIQGHSPLIMIAEHPDKLLRDPATAPALDVLKAIPPVWDETRVLPGSRIGQLSILARRKGDTWFIAALAGNKKVTLPPLEMKFPGYKAVTLTGKLVRGETLAWPQELAPGDGVVVWLVKEK